MRVPQGVLQSDVPKIFSSMVSPSWDPLVCCPKARPPVRFRQGVPPREFLNGRPTRWFPPEGFREYCPRRLVPWGLTKGGPAVCIPWEVSRVFTVAWLLRSSC